MTPTAEQMKFHLDQRRGWFHNWLVRWHEIGSKKGVEIDLLDGSEAAFGGIEYSGSAVHTYWDAIVRGVRKEVTEQFAWLDEQVRRYNSETADRAITECTGLLTAFAETVRRDAIEKDRVLRGRNGIPARTGADQGRWEGLTRAELHARGEALRASLPKEMPMVSVPDRLKQRVVAALVIDSHRPGERLLGPEDFNSEYSIRESPKLLTSLLEELAEEGMVDIFRDKDSASAVLRPAALRRALQQVINDLHATTFEVDARKERILADAQPYSDFPAPEGWDFVTFAKEQEQQIADIQPQAIHSESWTGPLRGTVLSEERRTKILEMLSDAENRLQQLRLDNSQRAQVLSFVAAAKQLAEAPEPPADMIWQLVERAAAILGIAGFFAQIMMAFS